MTNVLILGANSDMARAIALEFAKSADVKLHLASRNLEELERQAADMKIRTGAAITTEYLDATDWQSHDNFVNGLEEAPDVAVFAFGYLGSQDQAQADFTEAQKAIQTNFSAVVSLGEKLAERMAKRSTGCIVGIASVAGLRGRKSNYIYGAAKAGTIAFLSGLRNRLHERGVHVVTVLPGFVATKMTEGMDLPERLTTSPENVAKAVVRAVRRRENVIYVGSVWRVIMLVIRLLPEFVFKRTSI